MKKKIGISLLLVILEVQSLPVQALAQEIASDSAIPASHSAETKLDEDISALKVSSNGAVMIDPSLKNAFSEGQRNAVLDFSFAPISQSSQQFRKRMSLRKFLRNTFRSTEQVAVVIDNAGNNDLTPVIINSKGKKMQFSIREIVQADTRIFKILPPADLPAGKYLFVAKNMYGDVITQDFTWGVLALNSNKSVYTPGEDAHFSIGVLNDTGQMACDATVSLVIENAKLHLKEIFSTENKTILVNKECFVKGYTEKPDFETSYRFEKVGMYTLTLQAVTKNGTREITDTLSVVEQVPFSVERLTATRIYPPKVYPVTISVTANQDFSGIVSDVVPQSFVISNQKGGDAMIPTSAGVQADTTEDVLGTSVINLRKPFDGDHNESLGFGEQLQDPTLKEMYAKFGLAGHDGIDFDMPIGTPVLATDDGTVTLAKDADYGLTIVIQHSWGKSYYGHLSKILTPLNTVVSKGQQIALSGNTGLSTGSHLHFGIKLNDADTTNGYFGKINPAPYLGLSDAASLKNYTVKFVRWHVTMKKGEKVMLSYAYDAPDTSPEFYTLGPLSLYSSDNNASLLFKEQRQWQIAVDATTHMLLFWDPANGSAPTGWSVVTTYDGRFVRGEGVANVLATGGNATHTPTVSGSVTVNTGTSGRAGGGTNTIASYAHTHSASVTIGAANNLPAFRSMQLIQYDAGIPSTIPANAVALFDASPGMPGSGWTRITAQDALMMRINSSVATGGSDTHSHTLTWSALGASSGQITTGANTNNQGAATGHTHTAPAATTSDTQTSLPPYVHVVVASANSNTAVPTGMNAMFDGSPSASYTVQSESGGAFYQKFIRGNTVANVGTTGGSTTHSHGSATSGVSGTASTTSRGTSTAGTVAAGNGHTHTLTASFTANDDHTPQYVNFVIAEKIDAPDLQQIHSRWRNDDGSESTATFRRSEDVSATADINVNRRLRIEISNAGTLSATSTTYRIEYGQKSTTCDAISSWTAVPVTATTEKFQLYDSTNVTDATATSNVSGGLTDANTTFVAGQFKDTGNTTSGITLTTSNFTEVEYSFKVTSNATAGEVYCFRLSNAGSTTNFTYAAYPELTVGDPIINQEHYRFRNDDGGETSTTGNTLYFNPTGDGFASSFTIAAGCTSQWDCVDDGTSDTSASAPTNDGATSALTLANGVSYYTLADNAITSGSTITRLDVYAYAIDAGNPNTSIQLGYCTTCNGSSNTLGSIQAVSVGSYTQYTSAFTGLSLTTTDLNNMQLVVSADGAKANISTVYVLVTYSAPGATWKQSEDTAYTNQTSGQNIRLRISLANTGDIAANRNYRLEYAAKVGGSCGDNETFTTVPVTATSEVFEMTTSSYFTNGDATTTQLTATGLGTFAAGKMIEDPSNSSGTFTATNGQYTEVEYNMQASAAATGSYCFRVTDNGTALDTYSVYPEISISSSGIFQTPTHVQSTSNFGTNLSSKSLAKAFNSSVTSGNLLVVAATTWNSQTNCSVTSVTDSLGNTYSNAVEENTATGSYEPVSLWYAVAASSGSDTVTVHTDNATNNPNITMAIHEYSGIATSSPLDATNHHTTTNTSVTSNAASTAQSTELIIGAINHTANSSTISFTAGTNFTSRISLQDNASAESLWTEDRTVTSTGSYDASGTMSSSVEYQAVVATFKAAGGVGPTNDQLMRHGKWFSESSTPVKQAFTF